MKRTRGNCRNADSGGSGWQKSLLACFLLASVGTNEPLVWLDPAPHLDEFANKE